MDEYQPKPTKDRLPKNIIKGSVMISTTVSLEYWKLAKEHKINWNQALRRGIIECVNKSTNSIRISELEASNDRLKRAINLYMDETKKLRERLEELMPGEPQPNKKE